MRKAEAKETSQCYESNVGITTNSFCYMINERAAEETCKTLQEKNGFICNLPCRDSSCDTQLDANIVRKKYIQGAIKFICQNGGTERNTGCYKGTPVDETKYIRRTSCDYDECTREFNDLKEKNNWSNSCQYELVYKVYEKKKDDSEF